MPSYNALPLELLAEEFAKLPSIGMKTAQRLAYYIISQPEEDVQAFADALVSAKKKIHPCPCCQNLTDLELCSICADDTRDHSIICVVEGPKDVSALERTGEYTGVYHVLHGLISPIDGIMPDKLRIRELLARLQKGGVQEVIMRPTPPQRRCHCHVSGAAAGTAGCQGNTSGVRAAGWRYAGIRR